VVLSSFNPTTLWRVRRLDPEIATGLLYSPDMPLVLRRAWWRHLIRPAALHPDYPSVDAGFVRWAHERGYRVHTWTVDEPQEMWQMVECGVDLIITNRPDLLGKVLQDSAGRPQPADNERLHHGS
ncbi:MAG: glycerophosphodiester phosphodiesterase, partial [Anaerolineae bacterium]|nr:glycerophosphodiester phosphodiesterase [Anaerolineae bacterium]